MDEDEPAAADRRPGEARAHASTCPRAVELHVLPGLAERGPEDEKEEAQAHPERGGVLETTAQEGIEGGRGRGEENQAQGGLAAAGEGGRPPPSMLHPTSVVGGRDADAVDGEVFGTAVGEEEGEAVDGEADGDALDDEVDADAVDNDAVDANAVDNEGDLAAVGEGGRPPPSMLHPTSVVGEEGQ